MAIGYHIYGNGGTGGVDYSAPLASVSTLTWSSPTLAAGSTWTFAVRAYDTVTGLEESNVDARASLALDAARSDVSGLPNAPTGQTARPAASGSMVISWGYNPGGQGAPPTGFRVYAGTPAVSFAAPLASVSYSSSARSFSANIEGLAGGSTYQFVVRAYNAAGEEQNVETVTATPIVSGPLPVDSLTATVVP